MQSIPQIYSKYGLALMIVNLALLAEGMFSIIQVRRGGEGREICHTVHEADDQIWTLITVQRVFKQMVSTNHKELISCKHALLSEARYIIIKVVRTSPLFSCVYCRSDNIWEVLIVSNFARKTHTRI